MRIQSRMYDDISNAEMRAMAGLTWSVDMLALQYREYQCLFVDGHNGEEEKKKEVVKQKYQSLQGRNSKRCHQVPSIR